MCQNIWSDRRRAIALLLAMVSATIGLPCPRPSVGAPPGQAEATPPPSGSVDFSRWPRNPDKDCVGFALLFHELAGEGRIGPCDTPPAAEAVARKMWDRFTGKIPQAAFTFCDKVIVNGQSVGLTSPDGVAAITATLQAIYSNRCVAWSRLHRRPLNQGGNELGTRVEFDKLPINEWTPIGCAGVRTYSDKTQAASLHAVNICRDKEGTIWVFDNNDSSYHRCTYDANSLAWTSDYAKPGRPMGEATQRYTLVVDLRSVLSGLNKGKN